eukprot:GHRQ01038136.1.p1 GENE.GHRQ01038136.1~~GHRQ01038136.1.p1  ORF type:complete len:121 (-),score=33.32 GHRQ01038136.1:143-505(-)
MQANSFLAQDVDLPLLAERTRNFSGAEIEGLVKSAASYALNRNVDINDLHKPLDEDNIKVGTAAFLTVFYLVSSRVKLLLTPMPCVRLACTAQLLPCCSALYGAHLCIPNGSFPFSSALG